MRMVPGRPVMPKIMGITHWALPVNDLDESERFYAEVVGLVPRGRLGRSRMSCFMAGDQAILLCEQPRPPAAEGELAHYSFTLAPDEWEQGVRQLRQNG